MKKFFIRKNDLIEDKMRIIENINILIAENAGISDIEIVVNENRTDKQNKIDNLF